MTFDEYYAETYEQLTKQIYTTDDDIHRIDMQNLRDFLGRVKVGKDELYEEARKRVLLNLGEYHGKDANIHALEETSDWMTGLAMKKAWGNQ